MSIALFRELVVNFQTCFEKIFKQFEFSDSPSKIGVVVLKDLGNFDILLMLFMKLAELLLLANC